MKKLIMLLVLVLGAFTISNAQYRYIGEVGVGFGSNATSFRSDGDVRFYDWVMGWQANGNFVIADRVTIGGHYFWGNTGRSHSNVNLQAFGVEVGAIFSNLATLSIGMETTQPKHMGKTFDRRYHLSGSVWIYPLEDFKHIGLFASASTSYRVSAGLAIRW